MQLSSIYSGAALLNLLDLLMSKIFTVNLSFMC